MVYILALAGEVHKCSVASELDSVAALSTIVCACVCCTFPSIYVEGCKSDYVVEMKRAVVH